MKSKHYSKLHAILIASLILISMLGTTAMTASSVPVVAQPRVANSVNTGQLLQFTSAGHVLGFTSAGMYAANGSHAMHVDFVNANTVQPQADSDKSGTEKVTPLGHVTYADLWDGITLTYTAAPGEIYTTTYTLAPEANAKNIRLRYNAPLKLNSDGTLGLAFDNGTMTESAPVAWQEINGQRVVVNVSFQIYEQVASFALGKYDSRYALIIDPGLIWNTFLGGSGSDNGYDIATDGSGNVYVAGSSSPGTSFVAKLDTSGNLVWNTPLGGLSSSITVDDSGNIYVTGTSNYPWSCSPASCTVRPYTSNGDGFAAKLDSSGTLLWNTFLGGSGYDYGSGIAMDGGGNVYVTGASETSWGCPDVPCTVRTFTKSPDTYPSSLDAFVAKIDPSGNLTWNTFLGGDGEDYNNGIAVDGASNIYVTGASSAAWGCSVSCTVRPFTVSGSGFIAKLDSSGGLLWNTFLGDAGHNIALDGSGNIYITGDSYYGGWGCSPVPCTVRPFNGSFNYDGFAAKLDPSGSLVWNTFLGGVDADFSRDIAVDSSGNIYVSGDSRATWGNPLTPFSSQHDGYRDAFAAKLDTSGNLIWNTFLGGSGDDAGYIGIALDHDGNIYEEGNSSAVWGCSPVSCTVRSYTAGWDVFVAKIVNYFSLSGNAGIAGATLSYADGITKTVTADDSGNYTLIISNNWSGTVTPSKPGYTFSPSNRDYSASPVTTDLTDQDFTATQDTYTLTINSLHGTVNRDPDKETYTYGEVVGLTATPDAGWRFANWSGDATGTTNPVSVTINGNRIVTANYIPITYSISGNAGVAGATLSYTDGTPKTAIADGNGNYSLSVSYNWSGTVTPSKTGYFFLPLNKTYSNVLNNKSGENYLAYASIHIIIGSTPKGMYGNPPQGSFWVNYPGVDSGPVKVQSSGAVPIIAAERDAWVSNGVYTSFAQLVGLPASQLSDTYVFPAYNNVTLNEQLRIANVDSIPTTVTVTIGGVLRGTYPLAANEVVRVNYAGLDSGPVIVSGTSGVHIIAAERDAWAANGTTTSWVQLMGLPGGQLSDTYVFPAYNNVTLNEQLRIANVDSVPTTVTVTIGGVLQGTYPLAANTSMRVNYAGLDSGPVVVQGTAGVHIIAAERDAWTAGAPYNTITSFAQLMGLPGGQLSDTYQFPAHSNVTLNEQLRIANVDSVPTTVTVTIGRMIKETYPLAANGSMRVNYAGIYDGLVLVQGTPGVHIIAAERDAWVANGVTTSWVQLMGLPAGSLSDTYLFPAYNDVTLDEQLRFGVP